MVVIVTGALGIGKSTVCRKLLDLVRAQGYSCGGILSHKNEENSSIVLEDIKTGETRVLASTQELFAGPRTPRFHFNREAIDFGIQSINRGLSSTIVVVDEIGHLELNGEGFTNIITLVREKKVEHCILVIRKDLLSAFLPLFDSEPMAFETTIDNREQLPLEIATLLFRELIATR